MYNDCNVILERFKYWWRLSEEGGVLPKHVGVNKMLYCYVYWMSMC